MPSASNDLLDTRGFEQAQVPARSNSCRRTAAGIRKMLIFELLHNASPRPAARNDARMKTLSYSHQRYCGQDAVSVE